MKHLSRLKITVVLFLVAAAFITVRHGAPTRAQMPDRTQNPNVANFGIAKSLVDEIGAGRGGSTVPGSSAFIIARDPFRAIRRGRQLFQRKFLRVQGQGPLVNDSVGDINTNLHSARDCLTAAPDVMEDR